MGWKSHDVKIVFLDSGQNLVHLKKSQSEQKDILLKLILYCVPISKGHKFIFINIYLSYGKN